LAQIREPKVPLRPLLFILAQPFSKVEKVD